MNRVLHLSFADDSNGGGVYFYLKEFTNIQKNYGIDCHWITIKSKNLILKKKQILQEITEINPDIIHIHGIWNLNTRMIPKLKKITENIIVSPHGMLNEESLKKSYLGRNISLQYLKKQIYLLFLEKRNLSKIKAFHALTESELKEIRSIFPEKSIRVINSGFKEINSKVKYKVDKNLKNIFQKPNKILLFMSRLDHQKGLIELISAWNQLVYEAKLHDWFLLIAGFGPLKKNVISVANKLNSRIIFTGPKFGEEKNFILKNSKGFILPSYNEGLPVSVLEALSFGTTCLISKNCNINNLIDSNISLKINITKNSNNIKEALIQLFQLSDKDLYERENLGREYLEKHHKWDKIINETSIFYSDLYKI